MSETTPLDNKRDLKIVALLLTLAASAAILFHFYDRFWWPPDDGTYAYVAARTLAGDVLNRDIQEIHMGYISFLNALALLLFGDQLVSLRLPLVAVGIAQAGVVFLLFRSRSTATAMTAAFALTALSFVQFLNPTPHWYALFLTILIVGCLSLLPRESWWRMFVIGLLLTTIFLFRQLSGVIVSIGALAFLLYEAPQGKSIRDTLLARAAMTIMTIGLSGYLLAKTDATAFLLFGIWPLTILVVGCFKASAANREISRHLLPLLLGGLVAVSPLVAYHIHHQSLGAWYADTVVSPVKLTTMDFISQPRHLTYAAEGIIQILTMESVDAVINGLFWLSLVLITPVLGTLFLIELLRRLKKGGSSHPLPFLAVFYAPIAVHFQIPIYLFYSIGLSTIGLVWILSASTRRQRSVVNACALILAATGLYYHAAQPLTRGLEGILKGTRIALEPSEGLDRVGLSIEAEDTAVYRHILDIVSRETRSDQTVLAIPSNPEIYFITNRRSPFRFFSSALGVNSEAELADSLQIMRDHPPGLVFHRPEDKYNTAFSDAIIAYVRDHYAPLKSRGGFEIYRYKQGDAE